MEKLPLNPQMMMKGTGDTHLLRMWKKGFVTERLQWKCKKNGIKIVEVIGKGISRECSACGQTGYVDGEKFKCSVCRFEENKKVNGARNALNRGKTGKQINKKWSSDTSGRWTGWEAWFYPGSALAETVLCANGGVGFVKQRQWGLWRAISWYKRQKRRWGYAKTGTPVSCELIPWLHGKSTQALIENGMARSRSKRDGTALMGGCDSLRIHWRKRFAWRTFPVCCSAHGGRMPCADTVADGDLKRWGENKNMATALIFAGGTGKRMNTRSKPKQFLEIHGKPIIIYTLEHFEYHEGIDRKSVV